MLHSASMKEVQNNWIEHTTQQPHRQKKIKIWTPKDKPYFATKAELWGIYFEHLRREKYLTPKQLNNLFFQNVIICSNIVPYTSNIFV